MSKFLKGYLMLKILNNDKFTTAQNRHFLVSLKIPILNTLPVRAKVINNRCAHTFALTGRGALYSGTQGVALGWELAALSGRSRRISLFPQRVHAIR